MTMRSEMASHSPTYTSKIGWAIIVASTTLFYAAKKQIIPLPMIFPAILFFLVGAWLVRVGRKRTGMVDVEQAILLDGRKPILYLRSFSADGQSHFADITNAIVPESDEENLRDLFANLGLLVAIGRPGERLPEAGALRLYCSDDDWQSVVIRYLNESQIVIMRAGTSNAILWEVRKATEFVAPQNLLFFVPRKRWFGKDEYTVFRRNVKNELNWDLPAGLKFPSWIGFGEGWVPKAFEFAPTGFFEKQWPQITRSNVWVWRQVLLPWLDIRNLDNKSSFSVETVSQFTSTESIRNDKDDFSIQISYNGDSNS